MRPLRVGCLGELNWRNGSYALLLLITAAVASPAQFTSLHSFEYTDGKYVYAGLVQATDGNLYGTTAEGGANDAGTVFKELSRFLPLSPLLGAFCGPKHA